ncbi:branched-subunit amino acid transport protein AzlD [Isoptericola sp. CG 20/1183]|uniref:Branched-subunit amino acid transport protein AzlD n=1 Tax=Isoptericola halotolerans TaxID=300560 RepID=A0ABX5EFI1_9MICO|nr:MULTISPECIES: AzlD domain-containing protein [Isoptericola]MCK0116667.1 AzlD domain-containing protein [Isoptericola sp. S6320L]PRZ05633.1 branched-subunit amino acid transport protein AzlD [Isoptericola halotolerans]PRZ06201.1 branched-subunit amino acid transport protein AzlD [Isoptericola sp. CG 20/1183]
MTTTVLWSTVLLASVASFGLKLAGHLVPEHWLATARVQRTSTLVTVALLVSLVVVQTFAAGSSVVVDARVPALAVAAVALALRAPFIVVVVLAAAAAAGLRALGWG